MARRDAPRGVDIAAEAAAIERVLSRLQAAERDLRAIDAEVAALLELATGTARPNPRRAHELLTTAVNAVSAAERRLRRRLDLDREESARVAAGEDPE